MNPTIVSPSVLHQPGFNPPSFIYQTLNPVTFHRQQSQVQTFNPPNLNHPPVLEFTFVLEYMGERIAIQTDQPTRFQLLFLCNIASSALHNEYSPRNHIFRPMVAPRWLGRVLRVHSDALLRVIVHKCISRGEFRLHIWVYFIPEGHLQQPMGRPVSASNTEFPVIVDMGAVLWAQVDAHEAQTLPPLTSSASSCTQPISPPATTNSGPCHM